MKLIRNRADVSTILQVFIQNSSLTTGAGLTGLVYNTTSLVAYYHKDTDTTATAISLVTMTVGTYTSGGFKEIDATNMPGWYQFCPPNAAINTTGKSVAFMLKGATNMAPCVCELQIPVALDVEQAYNLGADSLPSAAAPAAAGGLPTADSSNRIAGNAGNVAGSVGSVTAAVTPSGGSVGSVTGSVGSVTAAVTPSGGSVGSVTGSVGSVTGNVGGSVASVTGNVGGSVASVTGSVGSVTGAVDSVTGAVGSVTGAVVLPTDFTSTMKTSITTAATAATPTAAAVTGAVGSVTGYGGTSIGSVTGSVGSVTGAVGSVTGAVVLPTDFTSTMKTSITTAATAATPVAASVTGAVGSVTGAVVLPTDFTSTMKTSITTAATAATPTVHLTYTQAIKKNTALATFMFVMFDPTGTPKTGLGSGITATRSLDGASFATCTNVPSEIANGWYMISLSAGDLNANVSALHFTATGAVAADVSIVTAQA